MPKKKDTSKEDFFNLLKKAAVTPKKVARKKPSKD
jgi:hypothetical protein